MEPELTLQDTVSIIADQTIYIRTLEKQNKYFRTQLNAQILREGINQVDPCEQQPGSTRHVQNPAAPQLPNTEASVNAGQFAILAEEHAHLLNRYRRLQTKHAQSEKSAREAVEKALRYKQLAREWDAYLKKKHPDIYKPVPPPSQTKDIPHGSGRYENRTFSGQPSQISTNPPGDAMEAHSNGANNQYTNNLLQLQQLKEPLNNPVLSSSNESNLQRFASSQTTVVDPADVESMPTTTIKHEPSSDSEPVVVSARSLKRKRDDRPNSEPAAHRIKQEPNPPRNPIDLQYEDYSNPTPPPRAIHRMETMDLDAIGPHVLTPHRSKRENYVRQYNEMTGTTPQTVRGELVETMRGQQFAALTNVKSEPNVESNQSFGGQDPIFNDQHHSLSRQQHHIASNVLLPISVNIPRKLPNKSHSTFTSEGSKDGIAMLSEDGDFASSQVAPSASNTQQRYSPQRPTEDRLDAMLEEPSSSRLPLSPRKLPSGANTAFSGEKRPSTSLKASVSANKRSPQSRHSIPREARGLAFSPPPIRPEEEPLRLRPRKSLRLEDFKINPRYLGTNFAFADTLRGRDQRRGLHTCTRPDCCGGALRKAIELGGPSLSGKTDAQALEAYLGPDWMETIRAYGLEERNEVVTQAHAFSFAGQHGKHRRAFERQSSPPGFWRTEMPSTQEAAEDRRKALEMERAKVEERWREAMREGGRWVFRDE